MTDGGSLTRRELSVTMVLAGSLWGLSEVGLNAGLRAVAPAFRASVLVGVGMLLMGTLTMVLRRPLLLLGAALIAIACRQLVVPILQVSVFCRANACIAVLLQGGAVAGMITLVGRRGRRMGVQAATAACAAISSAAAFWAIGLHVAPCQYLLSFAGPGGFAAFMAKEGILWAGCASVAFPVGCLWGERFAAALPRLSSARPRLYFASSLALTAGCWLACGFITAAGY